MKPGGNHGHNDKHQRSGKGSRNIITERLAAEDDSQMGERIQSLLDDTQGAPQIFKRFAAQGHGQTGQQQESDHQQQAWKSIVVLGDKSAGKTCLINRYVHGQFSAHRQGDAPTGMGTPFVTKSEELPSKGNEIQFQGASWLGLKIYDDPPGALKLLKQLAGAHGEGGAICVVVFDLTGGQAAFEKCKRIASKVADIAGLAVAIAGNKVDLVDSDEASHLVADSTAQLEEYAQSKGIAFYQVSAKTNASVTGMFREVAGIQTGAARPDTSRPRALKANQGAAMAQSAGKKGHGEGQHYFKEMANQKKQGDGNSQAAMPQSSANTVQTKKVELCASPEQDEELTPKGGMPAPGQLATEQSLEDGLASTGKIKSANRALAQALVQQMQEALARQRGLSTSSVSSRRGKGRRSPASNSTGEDEGGTSQQRQRRQHIVRREDGSILIINYEDFNQLISQPLSSIVTSSGASSGSHRPSSGAESSPESSRSSRERGTQDRRSAGEQSSSYTEGSSQDGYSPGSSEQASSSESARTSSERDPRGGGQEADFLLTAGKAPYGAASPFQAGSAQSTVRLDTSHQKGAADQTFEQLINNLNQNETANLTAALATILPESARDSIQVKIIDKHEAQREWAVFRENRDGMVHTFGCSRAASLQNLRQLQHECNNISKIHAKQPGRHARELAHPAAMEFPDDGPQAGEAPGGALLQLSYDDPSQRIDYDDVDSQRAISGLVGGAPSSPGCRKSEEYYDPQHSPTGPPGHQLRQPTHPSASGSMTLNGVALRGANHVLSFDEAMHRYSANRERHPCFQMAYQCASLLFVCLGIISSNCISFGLPLLTYYPYHQGRASPTGPFSAHALGLDGTGLQCYKKDEQVDDTALPSWLTENSTANKMSRWTSCRVDEVCGGAGGAAQYEWRIDPRHPEYMTNWVQKLNLLCKPQQLKWMTPGMALGVVVALTLVPSISDMFGRKNVYTTSLVISMIAQLALLLVDQSELAVGLLFIIGATWPGRCIIGTSYALEFFPRSHQSAVLFFVLLVNAISISAVPFSFQVLQRDFYLYQVLSLVMAFLSFTYCILLMPDSPWAYYMQDDFQRTRAVLEGVLHMNGSGDTRLLFRFKNESQQEYNTAIYDLERDRRSALSTHFESASNVNQHALWTQDGAAAGGRDAERTSHPVSNAAEIRSASNEGALGQHGLEPVAAHNNGATVIEEASRPKFQMNLLKIALIFCFLQLVQTIVKQFLTYYQHVEHNLSIFQKSSFFNSAELLGIVLGFPLYLLLGLRHSLWTTLLLSSAPSLATLYLIDRNSEYQLRLSSNLHQAEQAQFHHYLQLCQFALALLTAMATCSVRCAMFTDHSLLMPTRRVSAIGFVQLAAVLGAQCLAQLARAGSKGPGASYLWARHAGNPSSEASIGKQMMCTVLCLLLVSLLLGSSFADIWKEEKVRRRNPPKRERRGPQYEREESDEERSELLGEGER